MIGINNFSYREYLIQWYNQLVKLPLMDLDFTPFHNNILKSSINTVWYHRHILKKYHRVFSGKESVSLGVKYPFSYIMYADAVTQSVTSKTLPVMIKSND